MRRHQECKSPEVPDADGTVQAREAGLRQCDAILGPGAVPFVLCEAGSGECTPTENREVSEGSEDRNETLLCVPGSNRSRNIFWESLRHKVWPSSRCRFQSSCV